MPDPATHFLARPCQRQTIMKKSSREALDAYYAEAGSWAKDQADALRSSRRTAWWVAGAAAVIAVCEALALLFLTPLSTQGRRAGNEWFRTCSTRGWPSR